MQKREAMKVEVAAGAEPLGSATRFDALGVGLRRKGAPRLHVGLGGWLRWELIDRQGRSVRGGEQHNLFLDAGLNALAASPLWPAAPAAAHPGNWFTHACLGTGSTQPDPSDLTLESEVARTATVIADEQARPVDGHYVIMRTFSFGFGEANGNLTEWGIARAANGALVVRELIRDSNGTPITLTKTSDFQLRLTYNFEIALSPVSPTAHDVVIAGLNGGNPINGTVTFIGGSAPPASVADWGFDLKAFAYVAAGLTTSSANVLNSGTPFIRNAPVTGYGLAHSAAANTEGTPIFSSFTPGVWERSVSGVYGTAIGNYEIACIGVIGGGTSGAGGRRPGFVFNIDPGDRPTKDNEHILTINDLLTVTWGRA